MIGLLQRVQKASVQVAGETVGRIDKGLLILVGVQRGDTETQADRLLERVLNYRVFADAEERMNLSIQDINGGLLWVPQFTLAADTRKGNRPSFTPAAPPDEGERLFQYLLKTSAKHYPHVASGQFGAHMQVSLVNDGPVTFWLQTAP
jgi:D-tyrosyl-tRNA(Tyr) deacylase